MRKPSEIKIGEYTLKEILERHLHWLNQDCEGWENMKANLCNIDLSDVNLSHAKLCNTKLCDAKLYNAYLYSANLSGADLSNADLSLADLYCANLSNAKLCNANLNGANLYCANLRYTDLSNAKLFNANLCTVDFTNADLSDADLRCANLCCTDLSNTNMYNVELYHTNIYDTDLSDAENIPFISLACPSEGSFIAWKKVMDYLVKLEIPASAKRCSATTQKCRASKAKVLGIYTLDGKRTNLKNILNKTNQYSELDYVVGETVYPDSFDENRWNECSNGIHFFINKQDAIYYVG